MHIFFSIPNNKLATSIIKGGKRDGKKYGYKKRGRKL